MNTQTPEANEEQIRKNLRATRDIALSQLQLDPYNYRHGKMEGASEVQLVNAILKQKKDKSRYSALIKKFYEEGFTLSELPIVQQIEGSRKYKVLEGNRRVSILRLIHGYISLSNINLSPYFKKLLRSFPDDFKERTKKIRCEIYPSTEEGTRAAFQEIARLHSGGDAARDDWAPIAKAREERDFGINRHYELDLFEKFCSCYPPEGKYAEELEEWQLTFKLDQLDEATKYLSKLYELGGTDGVRLLSEQYEYLPESFKSRLDDVICAIGCGETQYVRDIRDELFWEKHGFTVLNKEEMQQFQVLLSKHESDSTKVSNSPQELNGQTDSTASTKSSLSSTKSSASTKTERGVKDLLRKIVIKNEEGAERHKLRILRDEMIKLDIMKTPNAFAVILRSFLDTASYIYCSKHIENMRKDSDLGPRIQQAVQHIKANVPEWKVVPSAKKQIDTAANHLTAPIGGADLSVSTLNGIVHSHDPGSVISSKSLMDELPKVIPLLRALTGNPPLVQ